MQQKYNRIQALIRLCCCFFLMALPFSAVKAQVTATQTDVGLTGGPNYSEIGMINCDMVDVQYNSPGDKLWAAVYHGADPNNTPISELVVSLESGGTRVWSSGTIALGNGLTGGFPTNPDVAIVNTNVSGCTPPCYNNDAYTICVVYEYNNHIYLETFDVSIPLPPTLPTAPSSTNTSLVGNAGSGWCVWPHIDAFSERNGSTMNGGTTLRDVAIAWTQVFDVYCDTLFEPPAPYTIHLPYWRRVSQIMVGISSDLMTLFPGAYVASHNDSFTCHMFENGHERGMMSDIAAVEYTSQQTGSYNYDRSVYVLYTSEPGPGGLTNINLTKADFDYTAGQMGTSITLLDNTHANAWTPRIDGQNLYDPTSGTIPWQGAVQASDPSSPADKWVTIYNDITSDVCTLAAAPDQHGACAVAGRGAEGVTGFPPGQIGQDEFTVAYYSTFTHNVNTNTFGDFYANAVDIGGMTPGVMTGTYYEVNTDECSTSIPVLTQPETRIAVSTSNNTGVDLLTVWAPFTMFGTGSDLFYKLTTGSTYAFKGTGIEALSGKSYSLHPNPAKTTLYIKGTTDASYSITNAIGQQIATGIVSRKQNDISVLGLPSGVYILNITENGYTQKLKFVKE